MDSSLTNEPVSVHVAALHDLVERAFANQESVVLLFRYANCGGAKDYFIARSVSEFQTVLRHGRPKTSITVFFKNNFPICGLADDDLCLRSIEFLGEVREQYEGIDLVRTDGTKIELDSQYFVYATTLDEIRDWFQQSRGKPVLVGTMEFWHDNSPQMVTVYVPDDDGVVRPGAY